MCADMDLVVLIDDENAGIEPSHFVQMMGDLLERVRAPAVWIDETGIADQVRRRILSSSPYQKLGYRS